MQVENIGKRYYVREKAGWFHWGERKEIEALKGVTLEIPEGKITGLLGLNGAGKSTLIKILTTLVTPTYGEIYAENINIRDHLEEYKKSINMIVGGERGLYGRLSAQENLEYFAALYSVPPKVARERIQSILKMVDLEQSKDIAVEKYSKGMKQRLQIARGLINNPKYLFLDEPTLGLDVVIAKEIRGFIKKIVEEENKAILLTSHQMIDVEEMCDYIYIIHRGKIIAEGNLEQIKEQTERIFEYRISFHSDTSQQELERDLRLFGEMELTWKKEGREWTLGIKTKKPLLAEIFHYLSKQNVCISNLQQQEPKLEEVLWKLLSKEQNRVHSYSGNQKID